jgi:Uri superfamily endonuclease
MHIKGSSYYSYSGIKSFCDYLKGFLRHYTVEKDKVVHKLQHASKALVECMQIISFSEHKFDEKAARKLKHYNRVIANFGSADQHEMHLKILQKYKSQNDHFYNDLISDFEWHLEGVVKN